MAQQVFGRRWSVWMADTVVTKFPELRNSWSYAYGVACKGLEQVYEHTGDPRYLHYIQNLMDYFLLEDGSIRYYKREHYNIDFVHNGKVLLFLYRATGDEKYARAAALLRDQLREHPRTSEGGFWHKKIYPHQMWLDGLYMGQPFYAEFIKLFEGNEDFSDVTRQFRLIDTHAKHEPTGLLFHGWDESRSMFWADKETGHSSNFWGRAMGWYACALVDTLDHLPEKDKAVLIPMVQSLAEAVVKVQSPRTGVWYQVLDHENTPGNYPECSCTCMFTYFLLKAMRLGYISKDYYAAARRGYLGVLREFIEVDQQGMLDLHGTVYVSGLGGDMLRDGSFDYYVSEPRQKNNLLGVGAFMMASVEMEKALAEKYAAGHVVE